MNNRALLAGLIALFTFVSCAPTDRPTLKPLVIKISEPAKTGDTVLIQGRYLGSSANGFAIFGANDLGANGTRATGDNIVSWSSTEIQVKIPAGTRAGGNFVFISVGGVLSNGLPYNVTQ